MITEKIVAGADADEVGMQSAELLGQVDASVAPCGMGAATESIEAEPSQVAMPSAEGDCLLAPFAQETVTEKVHAEPSQVALPSAGARTHRLVTMPPAMLPSGGSPEELLVVSKAE